MVIRLATILLLTTLLGCAGRSVLSDYPDRKVGFASLVDRQNQELESFASLLRVKLSREGRIDDFRVELFSRDSLLSLYVRGFLGKSVLKAIIKGDSLEVYFLSEKRYFLGLVSDLQHGQLEGADHIVDMLLATFQGSATLPNSANWLAQIKTRGDLVEIEQTDRGRECHLKSRFKCNREGFPYLKLQSLDLVTKGKEIKAHLQVRSVKFNREIPAAKFELKLPPQVTPLTREELVDLLTNIS